MRLRADGLLVWFDEWKPKSCDSIPAKIEGEWSSLACSTRRRMRSAGRSCTASTSHFRDAEQESGFVLALVFDSGPEIAISEIADGHLNEG